MPEPAVHDEVRGHPLTEITDPSPTTDLTVVIGSTGTASPEACLAALEPQRDGAQVIVCEPAPSPPELRQRFRWAEWVLLEGALVPQLWTEGIRRSRGDVVALTISPMIPADDWLPSVRAAHRTRYVVAGAIEPGSDLRAADWAEYFARYSPDMLPFAPRENPDLPGDNASYDRRLLEDVADTWADGFWEPVVHRAMAARGASLWHSPSMVVRLGRSGGVRPFVRQRLHHGRAHGRQRGALFGRGRNAIGVLASPIVPLLLTARMLRTVQGRRRHRMAAIRALPLLLVFNVAWALGEARGHLDALRGG
ncbi:MAG: hypothetical protein HZB46_09665 [Solirubrobacterales bacterium]|nr:hypothetical protein [Solirubrobacterales bacterium]